MFEDEDEQGQEQEKQCKDALTGVLNSTRKPHLQQTKDKK
jgi:hypothetical protein